MPPSRSPVRSAQTSYQSMANIKQKGTEAQPEHARASSNRDPKLVPSPPSVKKRRAPNAFILFRSIMIAKRLVPPELTHQNDVSCYVAEKWRSLSATDRSHFFRMAEENRKRLEAQPAIAKEKPARRRRSLVQRGTDVQSDSQYSFPAEDYASTVPAFPMTGNPPTINSEPSSPAAPQPIRPIPPEILQWDYDCSSDIPLPNMPQEHSVQTYPAYAFWPTEYDIDTSSSALGNNLSLPGFTSVSNTDAIWQQYFSFYALSSFPDNCSFDTDMFAFNM